MLDLVASGDDHRRDHRRWEQPVLHDARRRREQQRERLDVGDEPVIVGDDAAVRASRHIAQPDVTEPMDRRGEPELEQLERYRAVDRRHRLRRVGDDDEAIGRCGDELLAGVRGAASLHEPAVGSDLIGAVDRDVEAVDLVERLDPQPELRCRLLGARGRCDASDVELAPGERGQQVRHCRARAEPDGHPVFHELRRGLGREPLLVFMLPDLRGRHDCGNLLDSLPPDRTVSRP